MLLIETLLIQVFLSKLYDTRMLLVVVKLLKLFLVFILKCMNILIVELPVV